MAHVHLPIEPRKVFHRFVKISFNLKKKQLLLRHIYYILQHNTKSDIFDKWMCIIKHVTVEIYIASRVRTKYKKNKLKKIK